MNTADYAAELRRKAEKKVSIEQTTSGSSSEDLDTKRLLHELQVHQLELEMQNEELHRAIAEKCEHEAHLRDIIRQTPAGFFHIDLEGRFLDVNNAWLRMHGYDSPDEVIGKHFSIMQVDSDSDSALTHIAELQKGKPIPFGEFKSRRKDGSVGHHIFSAHPVVNFDRIVGFEWFIIDTSEQKEIEAAQMFLLETNALSDGEDFFELLAGFLAKALNMDFVCIDRLEGDGLTARTVAVWCDGHFEDNVTYNLKDTPCGDVVGKTVCCFPASVRQLFPRDQVLLDLQAESYVGVTLWSHAHKPIGLIAVISRRPLANRQIAEKILSLVGIRAAGEIERIDAEESLRNGRAFLRSLIDSAADLIYFKDRNSIYLGCNKASESFTGIPEHEQIGKSDFDLFDTEIAAQIVKHDQKVLRGCVAVHVEEVVSAYDGVRYDLDTVKTPIVDQDGQAIGLVGISRDITQQKREEQLITTKTSLLEFSLSHSLNELLTETLDKIEELTCSQIGFFHLLHQDQRTLTLSAWSTRTVRDFCKAESAGSHYDIDKAGVWVDCIHQRQPVIHNDYASLSHRKGLPPGHATVIRELAVPILRSDKIVGILGIGNKETEYTEEDIRIASRFADLAWDIAERKQIQDTLIESNELFTAAFKNAPVMITINSIEDGAYLDVNQQFLNICGFSREEVVGKTFVELDWIPASDRARLKEEIQLHGKICDQEFSLHTKSGQRKLCNYRGEIISVAGQKCLLSIALDVSEQRKAEQQLQQAQKMESIGNLAGGIAHDFNNMLTVIMGQAQLGLLRLEKTHPVCNNLSEIMKTAERSADLTRQLLAFARKQAISPVLIDLNEVIDGMLKMLRRLIGEDIHLAWHPAPGLWQIKADPSQIDQILANLCVNARDAIKGIGRITIETGNTIVNSNHCKENREATPGEYLLLRVSDDGCGMDGETMAHVFEPFFTTKGIGEGTGLGLATVYGIVTQNNGFIDIFSEQGKGTTFTIYLPRHEEKGPKPLIEAELAPLPKGHETILLVEDEPGILQITSLLLETQGYTPLTAGTPGEAMRLAHEHAGEIDLLMTDVIMPEMNGKDLVDKLRSLNPQLRCLYMSGYPADVITQHGVLDEGVHFIQKPFRLSDLAASVRKCLDSQLR